MQFLILFFTLLLSACVSLPEQYHEPVTQGIATVSNGSYSSGGLDPEYWETYIVSKIDNKRAYYKDKLFNDGYYSASWKVASGRRLFQVRVQFNDKKIRFKRYQAYVTVEANITPFSNYQLAGKIEDNHVTVWLVDSANGDKVSMVSTSAIDVIDKSVE